jgi:uridine kinase
MEQNKKENNIVDFIYSIIIKDCKENNKIIVGIAGASGVGKTTISKLLKQKDNNIEVLHTDDFQNNIVEKISIFKKLNKKSEIYQKGWFNSDKIKKEIEYFKNNSKNKILIIDGIFLLNKNIFANYIDKIIYIKMNEELLKKRKSDRLKINKLDKKENYLLFSELLDVSWKNYIKESNIEEKSDVVIRIK